MAAPVTAGVAALVREVHPGWSPLKVKAAIANTADASTRHDRRLRPAAGRRRRRRRPTARSATRVLATTQRRHGEPLVRLRADRRLVQRVQVDHAGNTGDRDVQLQAQRPARRSSRSLPSVVKRPRARLGQGQGPRVAVQGRGRGPAVGRPVPHRQLRRPRLALRRDHRHAHHGPSPAPIALRVPYLLVPRGLSDVTAELKAPSTETGERRQRDAPAPERRASTAAIADTYALGFTDPRGDGANGTDVRAVGVQTIPATVLRRGRSDRSRHPVRGQHVRPLLHRRAARGRHRGRHRRRRRSRLLRGRASTMAPSSPAPTTGCSSASSSTPRPSTSSTPGWPTRRSTAPR